jgi:DNA helicase-2/ATP-dependent DNA helicase PcrA
MKKEVYSKAEKGDPIHVVNVDDDRMEAEKIARAIWDAGASLYSETALFYRTNAQSRALEKALNDLRIPCVILVEPDSGTERKFAIYWHTCGYWPIPRMMPLSSASSNTPPRQIGKSTVDQIRERTATESISFWEALCRIVQTGEGVQWVSLRISKNDGYLAQVGRGGGYPDPAPCRTYYQ